MLRIIILLSLWSLLGHTRNEQYILKVNNSLSLNEAFNISRSINKWAGIYGIDRDLVYSIIHKESTFKKEVISETKDYGLMQINHKTIKHYGFIKNKLLHDYDYNIECGVFLLYLLKRKYGKEKHWWSRYHSSTPEFRDKYIVAINKIKIGVEKWN